MSETNTATVETPTGKPVAAKIVKTKAPKKPVAKPATKAKAKVVRDRSSADVPAAARRLALVKLLRKCQATKATTAKPISFLAEKLGYNPYDVYCLVYHKYQLAVEGFVKTAKIEDVKGLCVYLTAKGVKTDPE